MKFITLAGIFLRFLYRKSSFCVFIISLFGRNDPVKVVYYDNFDIAPKTKLLITGYWEKGKYGKQFNALLIKKINNQINKGLIEFLAREIEGVGQITAEKLVHLFGEKLKHVFDNYDLYKDQLTKLGISRKNIEKAIDSWKENREQAEIIPHFCELGLSVKQAELALKYLGAGAFAKIKRDPYILTQVKGIGFSTADKIAKTLNPNISRQYRLESTLIYALKEACNQGHCYLTLSEIVKEVTSYTGAQITPEEIENIAKNHEKIIVNNTKTEKIFYLKNMFEIVKEVTTDLLIRAYSTNTLKVNSDLDNFLNANNFLTDHQKAAIKTAFGSTAITYITGPPGTGKTTTVREIVNFLEKYRITYMLLAPTGKAAKRLTEQVERQAFTIHRALNFKLKSKEEIVKDLKESETLPGNLSAFLVPEYNETNTFPVEVIIVDEASMIDLFLFKYLLNATSKNTLLILIGDANQLPPVGPGYVFRDIVTNVIFRGYKLQNILRQKKDSGIIQMAYCIYQGKFPYFLKDEKRNYFTDIKFIKRPRLAGRRTCE